MFVRTLLLLFLVSTSTFAQNEVVDCSAYANRPIVLEPIPASTLHEAGKSGGMAFINDQGQPVISYEQALDNFPEAKNHVIAHECAHHILGHVHIPYIRNYWANENIKERPADCLASRILVEQLGYGEKEFNMIGDWIIQTQMDGAGRTARAKACAGLR